MVFQLEKLLIVNILIRLNVVIFIVLLKLLILIDFLVYEFSFSVYSLCLIIRLAIVRNINHFFNCWSGLATNSRILSGVSLYHGESFYSQYPEITVDEIKSLN